MTNTINTSRERLREVAMAVLQAAPDRELRIVALNKALFYVDLLALRDQGKLITGQKYVALPQGPVVENYKSSIVGELRKWGLAEQVVEGRAKPLRVIAPILKFEAINPEVVEMATEIGQMFGKYTSTFLSEYSHHNPGWQLAFKSYVEGRPAPEINMRIALQQMSGDDDERWVEDPADNAELMAHAEMAHLATQPWK